MLVTYHLKSQEVKVWKPFYILVNMISASVNLSVLIFSKLIPSTEYKEDPVMFGEVQRSFDVTKTQVVKTL